MAGIQQDACGTRGPRRRRAPGWLQITAPAASSRHASAGVACTGSFYLPRRVVISQEAGWVRGSGFGRAARSTPAAFSPAAAGRAGVAPHLLFGRPLRCTRGPAQRCPHASSPGPRPRPAGHKRGCTRRAHTRVARGRAVRMQGAGRANKTGVIAGRRSGGSSAGRAVTATGRRRGVSRCRGHQWLRVGWGASTPPPPPSEGGRAEVRARRRLCCAHQRWRGRRSVSATGSRAGAGRGLPSAGTPSRPPLTWRPWTGCAWAGCAWRRGSRAS